MNTSADLVKVDNISLFSTENFLQIQNHQVQSVVLASYEALTTVESIVCTILSRKIEFTWEVCHFPSNTCLKATGAGLPKRFDGTVVTINKASFYVRLASPKSSFMLETFPGGSFALVAKGLSVTKILSLAPYLESSYPADPEGKIFACLIANAEAISTEVEIDFMKYLLEGKQFPSIRKKLVALLQTKLK